MKKLIGLALVLGTSAFAGQIQQQEQKQEKEVVVVKTLACPAGTPWAITCSGASVNVILCPVKNSDTNMIMILSSAEKGAAATQTLTAKWDSNYAVVAAYTANNGILEYQVGLMDKHPDNTMSAYFRQRALGVHYVSESEDMVCVLPF